MTDEEIDLSEIPELTPEWFARAVVRHGLPLRTRKVQLTLRVDPEVLAWWRARGAGYQSEMAALLSAYRDAHRTRAANAVADAVADAEA